MVDIYRHLGRLNELEDLLESKEAIIRTGLNPEEVGEEMSFLERCLDYGCLVRSLESAFQAEATVEEWRLRVDPMAELEDEVKDIAKQRGITLRRIKQSPKQREENRKLVMGDCLRYIREVSEHDTPLGDAIKQHKIFPLRIPFLEVPKLFQGGCKVLLDMPSRWGGHIAHVGYEGDMIVRLSDRNKLVNYQPNRRCDALAFVPL